MFEEKIKLSEDTVNQIVNNNYDLGEILHITPLESGHESDNIKFSTNKGDYVLKLYFYPRLDQIEKRMKVLELLNEYGVKVPIPIKTNRNIFVAKFDENNLLVVITFISGEPIYRENKPLVFQWMNWFGKQFGIFHYSSKQITSDKFNQLAKNESATSISKPPGEWLMERYNERDKLLPEHEHNEKILGYFEKFLRRIEETNFSKLTTGIVHGDMMPGNFLKEREELKGILDFGGGYSYLMADIGTWIFYTGFYKPELKDNYLDFILPYIEHSKIPIEELKALILFLRSRAYVQYFYFAYRVTNNITQGYDDEEDPIKKNWNGFIETIPFIELVNSIDDNYFYNLAINALKERR